MGELIGYGVLLIVLGLLCLEIAVLWVASSEMIGLREAADRVVWALRCKAAGLLIWTAWTIGNGRRGWHAQWGEAEPRPFWAFGHGPRAVWVPDEFGQRCEREAAKAACEAGVIRTDCAGS